MTVKKELELKPRPAATEIEQTLLSTILINRNAIEKVSEFLMPKHFSNSFFAEVYDICCTLYRNERDINPISIKEFIGANCTQEERKKREDIIDELATPEISIVNVVDYGKQIVDRYIRRELIDLGYDMVENAYNIDIDHDALSNLEKVENKLFEISSDGQSSGGLQSFSTGLTAAINTICKAKSLKGHLPGVETGFTKLNKATGGLHNTDLIIIAGRPAMGKTALATCMAFNAAENFFKYNKEAKSKSDIKSVAFFSLEMSSAQLAARIISAQAQINGEKLRNGDIDQNDFNRIRGISEYLKDIPLFIDDTPGLTVNSIRTRAKRLKRGKTGLGLIIIDYLQLIESDSGNGNPENRVQEITKMTRQLKLMAKELNVPVVVLSQLNRGVETRDEKIPQLSDLRESGSIEQDADIVMAVYRESYYLARKAEKKVGESDEKFNARVAELEAKREKLKNVGSVVILKNRHGDTPTIDLTFIGQYSLFGNPADEEKPQ